MISIIEIIDQIILAFFYINEIVQRKLYSNRFFLVLIKFYEFLLLIYMILFQTLLSNPLVSPYLISISNVINFIFQFQQPNQQYLLASCLFAIFFVSLLIYNKFKQFSATKKELFEGLCCLIYVGFRLFYFACLTQILYVFQYNQRYVLLGKSSYLLVLPIGFVLGYTLIICRKDYLFGYFHPLFLFMWLALTNILFLIFTICLIIYRFYVERFSKNNFCLIILSITVFWCIAQNITSNTVNIELIQCLIIICILMLTFYFNQLVFEVQQNKLNQIQFYWQYTERKKESKITKSDQFIIQQIFMEQYLHENTSINTNDKLDSIKENPLQNWNKQQYLIVLESQVKKYSESNDNKFEGELLQYRIKLENEKRNLITLLEIRETYENSKSTNGFFNRYELYKLLIKLENEYNKYKSQTLYLNTIIQTDVLISRFYDEIMKMLECMYEIWKILANKQIEFNQVQNKYSKLMKLKNEIEDLYDTINEKCESTIEKQKLMSVLNILNWKLLDKNSHKSSSILENQNNLVEQVPFLVIRNNKIIHVPYKFLEKFKFKYTELYDNNILNLVPKYFQNNFINVTNIQTSNIKIQDSEQVILNGQGSFMLTRLEIYILPDFEDGIKYLYFFNDPENLTQDHMMILYCLNSNLIEDANESFCNEFNIDSNIFRQSKSLISGQEAFCNFDFNSDVNRKAIDSPQGINIMLSLKPFNGKNSYNASKIKVNLKCIRKFEDKQITRYILKLEKHSKTINMKSFQGRILAYLQQQFIDQNFLLNKANNDGGYGDNFLSEVLEKKENLKRLEGNRSLMPIHVILSILLIGLVSVILFVYITALIRLSWYDFMTIQIDTINDRNDLLIDIFFESFTIFQMNNWPPSTFDSAKISQIKNESIQNLTKTIYEFQINYIGNLEYLNFNKIYYNLYFDNFNLSVNTNQTVLMDFVWTSTLATNQSIVNFLIKNFQIIDIVRQEISSLELYFSSFNAYIQWSIIFIYIILSLILILEVASIYYAKKVEVGYTAIEELYSYLPDETIHEQLKQIVTLINNFSQIRTNKNTTNMIDTFVKQQYVKKQSIGSSQEILEKKEGQFQQKIIIKSKKFLLLSVIKIITTLGITCLYLIPITSTLKNEANSTPHILNAEHNLHLEYYDIKISLLKVYYNLINQQVNNRSLIENYSERMINTFQSLNNFLPNEFNEFIKNQWLFLNSNLCLNQDGTQSIQCVNTYGGVMTSGISETMVMYQQHLQIMNNMSIYDIYKDNLYGQNKISQKYILQQMNNILDAYTKCEITYRINLKSTYDIYFGLGILCICIVAFIFYIQYTFHSQRIQICKSLFNLFPENCLNNPQIKKHIEQSNLIDKIIQL